MLESQTKLLTESQREIMDRFQKEFEGNIRRFPGEILEEAETPEGLPENAYGKISERTPGGIIECTSGGQKLMQIS